MPSSSHPLSFAQQRLWFLDQLTPGLPLYNVPLVFDLEGPLNPETLRRALEELIRRHEPLRTVFPVDGGIPWQQVLPHGRLPLPVEDLSSLPSDERVAALDRLIEAEVRHPFNLQAGPILRTTVVRMASAHHVLVAGIHHISFDGWSSGVFFRELAALYGAFAEGRPSPLPELATRYVDFAAQQREWLTGDTYARQLAYWREQLRPPRPMLAIPTDHPRPAVQTHRGQRAEAELSDTVMTSLQALSRAEGVTLFMTLLAAYGVWLHRLSGQDDLIIGTPIANRTRQEIEPLVGFFANTLALRLDLSGAPTFRELLARTRRVAVGAYANQDLPFERLVEELNPDRSLSHNPIVQTFLVLENPYAAGQVIAVGDVVMRRRQVTTGTAKFDIMLFIRRAPVGRHVVCETSTDLYTAESGRRMLRDFCHLVEGLAEHVDDRLDRLPMWSQADRERVLLDWNSSAAPFAADRTLVELFEAQAMLTPEADAVLCGDERVSYAGLEARANRLARLLRRRGIGPDDRIGVCFHRSSELVVAVLAVLKAGGAYVPLDPAYPLERLRFIAQDAGCRVVLTEPSLQALASATGAELLFSDADAENDVSEPEASGRAARPDSLAYVIYTSGSTGTPKGVAIEHRQVVNLVSWATTTFTADERAGMLASTSIAFDLSVFELFVPLCSGGAVILVDNLLALSEAQARTRVTFVNSVPSVVSEFLRVDRLPPSVSLVAMAGEPLHPSLVARVYAEPSVKKVFDLYGPTETTVYATCALRTPDGPPTIGRPIANTTALVLDPQLEVVPIGVPGELFLGGAGVGRGYLGREDLTRGRFVTDPVSGVSSGRMYRTGDRVRWRADGSLEFLGRLDRQIKLRGFRIELGEIEAALLDHPGVHEAVVLKHEDDPDGGRLVAFVVAHDTDDDTLFRHLEARLPHYMLPSTVVRLAALPRLSNGKLDYHALQAPTGPARGAVIVHPRTATEEHVAEVWRSVLRLPEVGVEDHFFRIGGHSLLATQVTLRLRRLFDVELEIDTVFRAPTIAQQAQLIEQRIGPRQGRRESWRADPPDERRVPPPGWSGRVAPYPRDCAVSTLFEQRALVEPEAPALVSVAATLTYAQLNEQANRLAHYLRSHLEAVSPDTFADGPVPVGVALERSADVVIALLAILKAGGAYVPLDPTYPSLRLAALAERARVRCVITRDALRSRFTSGLSTIAVDADRAAIEAEASTNLGEEPRPEALAYVLFTSGTTGEPKAVGVPHRAIVRLAYGLPDVPLGPGETVLHLAPLAFDASTFEIWCPLLRGGRVAVAPDDLLTSNALEAFLAVHRVSVMWLTASLFNALIDDRPGVLAGLRCLLTGGEALSVPHVRRALSALPEVRLINGYGPTETTTFACCHVIDAHEMNDAPSVPIGRPLLNTRVYVLDADGQPLPPGEPGELWIGGDGVALGYLNDEALTASRFVRDPFAEEASARMYRSGDRVRVRADGALEFLGRLDDQVKIRGFRIEPGEVEAAIAQYPGVLRVAVIAADLPAVGPTLMAYVVLSPSLSGEQRTRLLAQGLRDDLRTRLPEFMVPAKWTAVDALPLLATGKLDRQALARMRSERDLPAPRLAQSPRSEIEESIAAICRTVLGVDAIGVDENFFDLGGHSLLMTQVVSRIQAAFRVELDLRTFFADPTVAGLTNAVRRLTAAGTSEANAIAPVPREQNLPLSYAQQRIWFLQHWYADSGIYNVPTALTVEGVLDVDALIRALRDIVDRHEALRTVFPVIGGHPVQQVRRDARLSVPIIDLSNLDLDAAEAEAWTRAVAESRRPFDLAADPLLRATLLRLTDTTSVLLLTLHHIVCDGWSLGVLFRELRTLYAAYTRGERASLPPLPVQYPDFAVWQRQYLTGDILERHLSYWRHQLRPPVAVLDWPVDRPHPVETTARGGHVVFDVPGETVTAVSRFSAAEGVTLFMTFLAAYQAVIHRYTGQDDVCVGTPVANRTRPEIEGLIGCFVNTLVLRGDLSGDPTFRRLVERTRDTAIDAQVHQELPFELLVDALKVRRSANRSPLFQAMLAVQDESAESAELPGVSVSRMGVPFDYAKFEFTLNLRVGSDRGRGSLEYNADLFDRATAEGFVNDFMAFLETALAAPDRRLSSLRVAGADARRGRRGSPGPLPSPVQIAPVARSLDGVSAIERQLEPLWREMLSLPTVGVGDNFFDLGGNSLTAIRLFSELERRFGVSLPLSTLFGNGTIEAQARLLASGALRAPARSPLVPIQPLGTRPPVFLVHGIGGEVLSFGALAGHLGTDQPIFGLQASRHDTDQQGDTIEAVAARYVAAIRAREPEGPYLLGGYSSGGILAYEMAQQLRDGGHQVALLAMVDAPAPRATAAPLTPDNLWRLVKNAAYWPLDDEFLRSGWAAQRARLRAKVKAVQARGRHAGTAAALAAGADVRDLMGLWKVPPRARRFLEHYVRMTGTYQPREYAGTVTLFRARTLSLSYRGAADLGWSRLARGGVVVHRVPGAHDTILKEPRVRRLAAALSSSLRSATDESK